MRVWIGKEMEGSDKGVKTCFVEARFLTKSRLSKVISVAQKYGINRLYFGANKKKCFWFTSKLADLKTYTKVYECSKIPSSKVVDILDLIILRNDVSKSINASKVDLKFDNGVVVKMYGKPIYTNITSLSKGLYDTDIKIL